MKVGKWVIGSRNSNGYGITDKAVIERFQERLPQFGNSNVKLVGLTTEGTKVWTLEQELAEMRGHFFGFIRSVYGREMLDARKTAMLEDMRLGRC